MVTSTLGREACEAQASSTGIGDIEVDPADDTDHVTLLVPR